MGLILLKPVTFSNEKTYDKIQSLQCSKAILGISKLQVDQIKGMMCASKLHKMHILTGIVASVVFFRWITLLHREKETD